MAQSARLVFYDVETAVLQIVRMSIKEQAYSSVLHVKHNFVKTVHGAVRVIIATIGSARTAFDLRATKMIVRIVWLHTVTLATIYAVDLCAMCSTLLKSSQMGRLRRIYVMHERVHQISSEHIKLESPIAIANFEQYERARKSVVGLRSAICVLMRTNATFQNFDDYGMREPSYMTGMTVCKRCPISIVSSATSPLLDPSVTRSYCKVASRKFSCKDVS